MTNSLFQLEVKEERPYEPVKYEDTEDENEEEEDEEDDDDFNIEEVFEEDGDFEEKDIVYIRSFIFAESKNE